MPALDFAGPGGALVSLLHASVPLLWQWQSHHAVFGLQQHKSMQRICWTSSSASQSQMSLRIFTEHSKRRMEVQGWQLDNLGGHKSGELPMAHQMLVYAGSDGAQVSWLHASVFLLRQWRTC